MKATVYSHNDLIGTADLKAISAMGVLYGDFIPNSVYFKKIQPYVWNFYKNNSPNYQEWYSLRFNIQLENGYFVFPQGGYTISDIQEFSDEILSIDAAGVDYHILQDYFFSSDLKKFPPDNWEVLTIEKKIMIEDIINEEININSDHPLTGFELSILIKHSQKNTHLLCLHSRNLNFKYAVVDLDFSVKRKISNKLLFFKEFEDFLKSNI